MQRKLIHIVSVIIFSILAASAAYTQDNPDDNVIWLIKPEYDGGDRFSEGFAGLRKGKKIFYIDRDGKVAFEVKCTYGYAFSEGIAQIFDDDKWGYIDKTGKIIIEPQYDTPGNFSNGFAVITKGDKFIYLNRDGKECTREEYESQRLYPEGLVPYSDANNGKYGFKDKSGKVVIEPKFDSVEEFSEGLARFGVKNGDKTLTGFIDKKGKIIIPAQFGWVSDFSEGIARIPKRNNTFMYIDRTGKPIIDRDFPVNSAEPFSEGLAAFKENDLWGYMDTKGNTVIKPQFQFAKVFSEGLAVVRKDGKVGIIKNPLAAVKQQETLTHAGLFIGTVKSVKGKEIVVGGKDIASTVYMGDKLCLYSGENIIILRSSFPMQTVTKCELISGDMNGIKPGIKVYKYRKDKKEK